jgi:hypothetical protein
LASPLNGIGLNPSAEVIHPKVPEPVPLDPASSALEGFQTKPTVTVTRPTSHREGWPRGAGGTPASLNTASATLQTLDSS